MFPFSPVCVSTTLSTNLMFYGYTINSCSSAEDILGALGGTSSHRAGESPEAPRSPGEVSLRGCFRRQGACPLEHSLFGEAPELLPQSVSLGRRPVTT